MKNFFRSTIAFAILVSGTNTYVATAKGKSQATSSNSSNKSQNRNQGKKSSSRDALLGITSEKWNTNATAVIGINSGIESLSPVGFYGGPGVNLGVGYQFLYKVKTDYSLYGNAEFQYDFFAGLAGTVSHKMNLLGVKLRIGLAFMEDKLKAYLTLGLMGVMPSYTENGFAALFGIGVSQDIIKRRLAVMLEFEGGPTAGINALDGAIILRLGVRGSF